MITCTNIVGFSGLSCPPGRRRVIFGSDFKSCDLSSSDDESSELDPTEALASGVKEV